MKWLLYQRLADGGWAPPWGGPWLWLWASTGVAALLASVYLLVFAIARIRRGRLQAWLVVWWVIALWVLAAVEAGMHSLPRGSGGFQALRGVFFFHGGAWAMYGILVTVPLLGREDRMAKEERKALTQGVPPPTQGS